MPYIDKKQRTIWGVITKVYSKLDSDTHPGVLNYLVTKLLLATKPKGYGDYNKLIGVLECVKQELYRKQIASYEDDMCEKNGEVL